MQYNYISGNYIKIIVIYVDKLVEVCIFENNIQLMYTNIVYLSNMEL